MKRLTWHYPLVSALLLTASSQAKTITVNTENNADFSAGKTNLVTAIRSLADGDTINFNIPGSGVHYLLTPVDGYPLITNSSVTIDGYSQPGAVANSNPIHAANNATLKIVLSSTNGNGIAVQLAAQAVVNQEPVTYSFAHPGFNANDNAILAFFRGTNNWVKGLVFQGVCGPSDSVYQGTPGPLMGIVFMADEPGRPMGSYNCGNWHVSGCWFGVDPATGKPAYMPDGSLATPIHGIDTERNRNQPVTTVNYEQPGTIGVAVGSANPRAEFNVFLGPVAAVLTGLNWRISGNFFNVLPDGMHNLDIAYMARAVDILPTGNADATLIFARQNDNIVIGTDGDGVNDADEGNVFGGMSTYTLNSPAGTTTHRVMDAFYGPSPSTPTQGTNIVIAGNYFGVAVDGMTRFTNACTLWTGFSGTGQVRIGSDFDGVSDSLEANVIMNNYPFSTQFPEPGTTDYTPASLLDGRGSPVNFTGINAGARVSFRGNVTVGNDQLPCKWANSFGTLVNNFTNFETPYMDVTSANGIIPALNTASNVYPQLVGTFAPGKAPYTTIILDIYQADPEGWFNGQLFNEVELQDATTSTTNGFPQGKKYLGSVVVPNTGSFNITLPGLADAGSGLFTVAVNYSVDPAGTKNGRVHTSNFANPIYLYPGKVEAAGLTHIVADVPCWYDTVLNGPTNGPINLTTQSSASSAGGNWEPYIGILGDSTFLIEFNTFANDGTYNNQNNAVAKQPATGGPAKIGYAFYADDGTPFKGQVNLSRQNGNPGRVAGDLRYGGTKFITEAEVSLGQLTPFQSDTRWNNNNIYQNDDRYAAEQIFSLDPATLTQTPVTKAWDFVYGPFVGAMGAGQSGAEISRTGGRPNFLDNGDIVVMIDDKTRIVTANGEVTTFAIIHPDGTVVKGPTLVDSQNIFDNMCAVKGGFVIRVHDSLYFYNNSGTLMFSNSVIESSGLSFTDGTGRGDSMRIAGDIRSYYVYGACSITGGSQEGVAVWDTRTGQFVASAIVSDGDPSVQSIDRTGIAVDAYNRLCVAYACKPNKTVFTYGNQVVARVGKFDGTQFTWYNHSFYPFVNHDEDPNNVLGFITSNPYVAMSTRQICIAAKGTINSTNSAAAGPNSLQEQTVYTVLNHPDPVAAPVPSITVTQPDSSHLTVSWSADAGLFTVQTKSSLTSGSWTAATAGNVLPPVTLPIGAGSSFIRLAR